MEDRLLNYIWVYKDKKHKREKHLVAEYFQPRINKSTYSSRVIASPPDLPVKENGKIKRMRTQVWIEKEKKRLQKEIGKSVSGCKGKKPRVKARDVAVLKAKLKSERELESKARVAELTCSFGQKVFGDARAFGL